MLLPPKRPDKEKHEQEEACNIQQALDLFRSNEEREKLAVEKKRDEEQEQKHLVEYPDERGYQQSER